MPPVLFSFFFLFFYLTSIFLSKLLFFISAIPFLPRNEEEYEYGTFSDEGSVEEEVSDTYNYDESPEKDHLVADIIGDGEDLLFLHTSATNSGQNSVVLSSGQNSVVFDEETVDDILEAAAVEEKEDEEASTRSVGSSDDLSSTAYPKLNPNPNPKKRIKKTAARRKKRRYWWLGTVVQDHLDMK
ncbi:hypothetical protein Hdeb2414_s0004g00128411 [Helianthus debilis subsp. tardiflorus]